MAWITPITDRTQADIILRNSKAFLNAADWTRIYDNTEIVFDLFVAKLGNPGADFPTIDVPTTATIPTSADVNLLLECIEQMRLTALNHFPSMAGAGFAEIGYTWGENYNVPAPNFTHVNNWESVLNIMYPVLDNYEVVRVARCGVAVAGAGMTRNNAFRG